MPLGAASIIDGAINKLQAMDFSTVANSWVDSYLEALVRHWTQLRCWRFGASRPTGHHRVHEVRCSVHSRGMQGPFAGASPKQLGSIHTLRTPLATACLTF